MIMYVLSVTCTQYTAMGLNYWYVLVFMRFLYMLIATAVGAVVAVVVSVVVIDITIYFNFMPFINCDSIVVVSFPFSWQW